MVFYGILTDWLFVFVTFVLFFKRIFNKEFGNIIVGFVLAWSVIFIVEFVMRFLGLPTLTQISFDRIDSGDPEVTNVIIIN